MNPHRYTRRPGAMFAPDLAARPRTRRWVVLGVTLFALFAALASTSSAQAAGPKWKLTVTPSADYFLSGSGYSGVYKIEAENIGGEPTDNSETIILENVPPAGTIAQAVSFYNVVESGEQDLGHHELAAHQACPTFLTCRYPEGPLSLTMPPLHPHKKLVMLIALDVPSGVEGSLEDIARISGGGAAPAEAAAVNAASSESDVPFGLLHFDAALTDSAAHSYTQAGGHPYQFTTEFDFETYSSARANEDREGQPISWPYSGASPVHDPKDVGSDLPPGLLANPQAVPHCSLADFYSNECPLSTVVGRIAVRAFGIADRGANFLGPIYNLQPTGAYPGELGFYIGPPLLITAGLRSGSDYGVTATVTATEADLSRSRVTLWGVPADPSHNALRGKTCNFPTPEFKSIDELEHDCEGMPGGGAAGVESTPFLTMPTQCTGQPLTIVGRYDTWDLPGQYAEHSVDLDAVDGCNALSFEPEIEAHPTTTLADAPSGFDFNLKVPQDESVNGDATPSLKEAVVTLPQGLTVNPSSANGLSACSPAQIGLTTPVATTPAHFTESPANCPAASTLGTVEVNTALLHNPLDGFVYLATPHQNPSGSLLAGYIVLEGEGLIIKLAGQFQTDPNTGQITASFLENPQTPFEEFRFHFFEGARGALRTPAVCGSYEVHSTLTPYSAPESGPAAEPSSEFETTQGPQGEGSPCPGAASEEPHAPLLHAGTESPQAGAYSPFSLKLVREDGSQELTKIDTTLPPGLTGKLAGIAECSDAALATAAGKSGQAEQASPSCPLGSEVGTVDVAAGAGPTPLNVGGKAYLAGPYKSAPFSLAIITPAVAGPFDLGTVVVRAAIYPDLETTRVSAKSDLIPTILQGIPLDLRSVTVKLNRPNFMLNPTNCSELGFTGSALSILGSSAPLSQRFQVGGCQALPFKPKLSLSLKGSTKRAGHPALKAVLTAKPGEANIAASQVTLPHSAFLEQSHIRTICTRVQFAANACPAASIYGKARAITPLLDKPLEGPVYLRSSSHQLPDLVADLNGQIHVVLDGHVDSVKGGIRNTFEAVPDAPVSKFVLEMQGANKGLIVNSENLCSAKAKTKAIVSFTGQNGKTYDTEPTVANSCAKKGKKKNHKHGKGKHPSHRLGTSHR